MEQKSVSKPYVLSVIVYSLVIAAFAQFRADLLIPYFVFSFGIVLLPFLDRIIGEEFPLIPVAVLAGLFVSFSRVLTQYAAPEPPVNALLNYLPETLFYCIYGALLYLSAKTRLTDSIKGYCASVFLIDMISNVAELCLRIGASGWRASYGLSVCGVAAFRTLILYGMLRIFQDCQVHVMRNSEVRLYRKLLTAMTQLAGENIWMQENMNLVERTMASAYTLYDQLNKDGMDTKAAQALSVATNVHEIKKQYRAVADSLSSVMEETHEEERMDVRVIAEILLSGLRHSAKRNGLALRYQIDCPESVSTRQYYQMMSVLNNLFTNAIEAAEGTSQEIRFEVRRGTENWQFAVINTGKPIPKERLSEIWEPGYSTKINYESGVIGRGLGLPVVKELLEQCFHGTIEAASDENSTRFMFQIPIDQLEVQG